MLRHLRRLAAAADVPAVLVALAVAVFVAAGLAFLPGPGGSTALRPEALAAAGWDVAPGPRAVEAATLQRSAFASLARLFLTVAAAAGAVALITGLALELARGSRLRRSLAVRAAVGAPPRTLLGRLVRARLRPLLLRGVPGGALLGVGAAWLMVRTWPGPSGMAAPAAELPAAVLAVALLVGATAIAPLRAAREPLTRALAGGGANADPREGGLRRVLSVLQLAAGLSILAAVAGALLAGDPAPAGAGGSDGDTVLVPVALDPALPPEARGARWTALLERARAVPTLTAESLASPGAWAGLGRRDFVLAECGACVIGGLPVSFVGEDVFQHVVSPGFFRQAGLRVLDGRGFGPGDGPGADRVAVVSISFAREDFEDGDPLGHRIRVGAGEGAWHTVVGVVDEPERTILGRAGGEAPAVYLSLLQHPPDRAELALGGLPPRPSPGGGADAAAAGGLDPGAAGLDVDALDVDALVGDGLVEGRPERLDERRRRERAPLDWFAAVTLGAALLALAVALLGAASVAAVEVRARRKELGVRAALGASPRSLLAHVLARSGRASAVAVLLAVPATVGVAGVLREAAGGLPLFDAGLFAALALLLAVVSLLGALEPARAAARTDPARVLAGE